TRENRPATRASPRSTPPEQPPAETCSSLPRSLYAAQPLLGLASRDGLSTEPVCPLMQIATAARPTEVRRVVVTPVLAGDDVLQMNWPLVRPFRKSAVFATPLRTGSDEVARFVAHRYWRPSLARARRALAFRMEINSPAS